VKLTRKKRFPEAKEIYDTWIRARQLEAREGRDLSAGEFLNLVSPSKRGRTEASAKRLIRKLRGGETSGTKLLARARADSGKTIAVVYGSEKTADATAILTIPYGQSRLYLFGRSLENRRRSRLREASQNYIDKRYKGRDVSGLGILGGRNVTKFKGSEKVR